MTWNQAKAAGEAKRVAALTEQAKKMYPTGDFLYLEVLGAADRDRLLRAGWELQDTRSSVMVSGRSFSHRFLLRCARTLAA